MSECNYCPRLTCEDPVNCRDCLIFSLLADNKGTWQRTMEKAYELGVKDK